jgi:SAM-dependent methyltransferase
MNFDEEYTKYWSSAVNKSVDGTVIAGQNEVKYFLQELEIKRGDYVLDLGCSFGRMYDALAVHSDWVFGVDPDPYAVEKASLLPYKEVREGYAEHTGFDASFFHTVFCWAVFDVVDHKNGLLEINRILRSGGQLLLSGKNNSYSPDDILAFKAEKNAFLKGFPGRFTDLKRLLQSLYKLGMTLEKVYIFPRRGDFGLMNFVEQTNIFNDDYLGYEYLVICRKCMDISGVEELGVDLEAPFSKTATDLAVQAGFLSPKEYFESIGID